MTESFFTIGAKTRLRKDNILLKLNKLIDWDRIARKLKGLHKNEVNPKGGPIAYEPIKMFKSILLGQWYSLSDPALEESIQVRIDFMFFTGFEISDKLPDETTFCRFRNKLIDLGLIDNLFADINLQLEEIGLKIRECEGAIIDATIIESCARPRKTVKVIPEDRNEDELDSACSTSYSNDPDARWLKKGKKTYFGYKGYIRTDSADSFIEKAHVTPANKSECKELGKMTEDRKQGRISTDKGYASAENRKLLKRRGLKDGIMSKASRGNPLSSKQLLRNKLISRHRYKVEQCFGTLKRKFQIGRARYRGLKKVYGELCLKSICFNLNKALRMIKFA